MNENEIFWECSECGNDNGHDLEMGENILECFCCNSKISIVVSIIK